MSKFLLMLLLLGTSICDLRTQTQKSAEVVQYAPSVARTVSGSLVGSGVQQDLYINLNFAPVPENTTCGRHCVNKAYLVVSFHVGGAKERYTFGRTLLTASASFQIAGINQSSQIVVDFADVWTLNLSGATPTQPLSRIVLDITNRVPNACTAPDLASHGLRIKITGLSILELTAAQKDSLVFSAQIIEEHKIHPDDNLTLDCATDTYVKTTFADTSHPVSLTWVVKDESTPCQDLYPMFEVEVLRLYNRDSASRADDDKVVAKVNWQEAQRFLTYGAATKIEFTLAEGTGYYAWRVRPIGNYYDGGIANQKNWGCWSKAPEQDSVVTITGLSTMAGKQDHPSEYGGGKPLFYYRQFDRDKNWIFNRTFAEDDAGFTGISEGITYASSLMQPLQVQTPVTSSNDVLVQQTILDFEGRPLVATLAAPKVRISGAPAALMYVSDLTKDVSTSVDYRAAHFDNSATAVNAMSGVIDTYWSSSNVNLSVPSAQGYAFQRTVLSNDPLARTVEQSAVGVDHKIGNSRTVRTTYGPASDRELVVMFGNDAPVDSAVSKVATTDQNGVTSIAYVRFDGKTLATCLIEGPGNSNLLPLNDSSVVNSVVIDDTLRYGQNVSTRRIIAERPLQIVNTDTVTFNYWIKPKQVAGMCADFCATCDYFVKVEVINAATDSIVYSDTKTVTHGACPEGDSSTIGDVTKTLTAGNYILRRTLTPTLAGGRLRSDTVKGTITVAHRATSELLIKKAFNASGYATDVDSLRMGKHLTNEPLARRMLLRYKIFRDSIITADSMAYVQVYDCCVVVLDSTRCKTGCETDSYGRFSYEKLLFDRWEDVMNQQPAPDSGRGRTLAAYLRWYDGRTLVGDIGPDFEGGNGRS